MGQMANIWSMKYPEEDKDIHIDEDRLSASERGVEENNIDVLRVASPNNAGTMDQLYFTEGFSLSIVAGWYAMGSIFTDLKEHDWCVLRLRLCGKVEERLGEQTYHFEGPHCSLLYCTPGIKHQVLFHPKSPLEGVSVLFRPSLIESRIGGDFKGLLARLANGKDPHTNIVTIELSSEMEVLVHELMDSPRTGQFYRLWAEIRALELICQALSALETETEKHNSSGGVRIRPWDVRQFEKVRALLDSRYCEPPSIMELCNHSGMNRRKLTEGFRILFSCTITEYIQSQRMLHARSLLRQSLPIKMVAEKVGYNDPSSFTKIFKRRFGVLPRSFGKT